MRLNRILGVIVLAGMLLASCAGMGGAPSAGTPAGTSGPIGEVDTPAGTEAAVPPAVQAAQQALAQQLGIDPSAVTVQGFEQAEWPDGCLGLGGPAESCLAAIVPGYGGILSTNGQQWEFRTDESGESVRFVPGAALSARQVLAQQLHLDLGDIRITGVEKVEWPNACLGVEVQGMACAEVVTPGYKVTLEVNGETYEFHTDENGNTAMLAAAPQAEVGDALLTWQSTGGVCETAQIGPDAVAFGTCGGSLVAGNYSSPQRMEELSEFVNQYAAFDAETPAGKVTFQGQGTQTPTPAERRMLAEWAHLVFQEAAGGPGGASSGLAFIWHREGGIAGFCDDLAVYVTGEVLATTCGGGPPDATSSGRLTSEQLEQVYGWIDSLKPFEIDQKDPAVADAMSIRLVFSGEGQQEATEADQAAIQDFSADLYDQFSQGAAPSGSAVDQARGALLDYFEALNAGDYARAVERYGGSYETLERNNPDIQVEDRGALFEAGCRFNGFQCALTVMNIIEEEQVTPEHVRFVVEFQGSDGQRFELGPCCGEDPTATPPVTQFEFNVLQGDGTWRLQELPVYVP